MSLADPEERPMFSLAGDPYRDLMRVNRDL
jgi:hypothetical protein